MHTRSSAANPLLSISACAQRNALFTNNMALKEPHSALHLEHPSTHFNNKQQQQHPSRYRLYANTRKAAPKKAELKHEQMLRALCSRPLSTCSAHVSSAAQL
jgi:hypothetical protein